MAKRNDSIEQKAGYGLDIFLNSCLLKEITMKMLIEIRAAEGGDDSKLFVGDLANAYMKLAGKFG